MAILNEMRFLVGDLEAAFSRRIEAEQERQATATRDARGRAMDIREQRAAAAEDARERLAEISRRSGAVADMVDSFFRDRTAQAASDARDRAEAGRERVKAERERLAETAEEARARMAELNELSAIWSEHTAVMEDLVTGAPRTPVRKAAQRPHRKAAPGAAAKPTASRAPAKPAAPKAAAPEDAET